MDFLCVTPRQQGRTISWEEPCPTAPVGICWDTPECYKIFHEKARFSCILCRNQDVGAGKMRDVCSVPSDAAVTSPRVLSCSKINCPGKRRSMGTQGSTLSQAIRPRLAEFPGSIPSDPSPPIHLLLGHSGWAEAPPRAAHKRHGKVFLSFSKWRGL